MNHKTPSSRFPRKILGGILCISLFFMLGGCGNDSDKGPAEQAGEKIDNAIKETGNSMKDAMKKTGTAVNEAAESAGKAVNDAVEGTQSKMDAMGKEVKETTQETVEKAEKMVEDTKK